MMQSMSNMYTLLILLPKIWVCLQSALDIRHIFGWNVTCSPLSHSWLMLNKLCFNSSTSNTFFMSKLPLTPMFPLPMIMPLLLSPLVTKPPCFSTKLVNKDASPVICLEHPLSRYHNLFLAPSFFSKTD